MTQKDVSFVHRPDTMDSSIVREVLVKNEYRLPDRLPEDSIVIDIGAHIGVFAEAVLQRGAAKVYAVEADFENYALSRINLRHYVDEGRVILKHGAVWRSDPNQDVLFFQGYCEWDGWLDTGGGRVGLYKRGNPIPKLPFDHLLIEASNLDQRRVALLKLDCEGAEWPILLTSTRLDLVDEIVGEFHEIRDGFNLECNGFTLPGYDRFTSEVLVAFLAEQGFTTECKRCEPVGKLSSLGLFKARRHPQGDPKARGDC